MLNNTENVWCWYLNFIHKKFITITDFREQSQRWQENTAIRADLACQSWDCHRIQICSVRVNTIHQVKSVQAMVNLNSAKSSFSSTVVRKTFIISKKRERGEKIFLIHTSRSSSSSSPISLNFITDYLLSVFGIDFFWMKFKCHHQNFSVLFGH